MRITKAKHHTKNATPPQCTGTLCPHLHVHPGEGPRDAPNFAGEPSTRERTLGDPPRPGGDAERIARQSLGSSVEAECTKGERGDVAMAQRYSLFDTGFSFPDVSDAAADPAHVDASSAATP